MAKARYTADVVIATTITPTQGHKPKPIAGGARTICGYAYHGPEVLRPYDFREGCQIEEAAGIAGKSVRTMRVWAEQHHIARRVGGGSWVFSRVALQMFLDGDAEALRAYLAGDRSTPIVVGYFDRAGLTYLIERWRSFDAARTAVST